MAKRRLFLTGSERAEFEHIYGPLTVDSTDTRFVLVDDEVAEKIAKLPPGVPVRSGQHPVDVAAIRAAEVDAAGADAGEFGGVNVAGGSIGPKELDIDFEGVGEDSDVNESQDSVGDTNESVAESGKPAGGGKARPSAESRAKSGNKSNK